MTDPAIARAKLEIAGDQALIRSLTSDELPGGPPRSAETRKRIASLDRLIAANKAMLDRLSD